MKWPTIKSLKWTGGVVALIVVLRFAVPVPLEGNWTGGMSDCLCGDGHQFTRFANGRAVFFHEGTKPKPSGTYRKIGWNKFPCLSGCLPMERRASLGMCGKARFQAEQCSALHRRRAFGNEPDKHASFYGRAVPHRNRSGSKPDGCSIVTT